MFVTTLSSDFLHRHQNSSKKKALRSCLEPFGLLALICSPQILLYAKSGITSRYMLPATIGLSFFTVSCMRYARINGLLLWQLPSPIVRKIFIFFGSLIGLSAFLVAVTLFAVYPDLPRVNGIAFSIFLLSAAIMFFLIWRNQHENGVNRISTYRFLVGMALLTTFYAAGPMYEETREYALRGKWASGVLQAMINHTADKSDAILVVADPARNIEACFSLYNYLNTIGDRSNVYFYRVLLHDNNYSQFDHHLIDSFENHLRAFGGKPIAEVPNVSRYKVILFFPGTASHVKGDFFAGLESFSEYSFGEYQLYVKAM